MSGGCFYFLDVRNSNIYSIGIQKTQQQQQQQNKQNSLKEMINSNDGGWERQTMKLISSIRFAHFAVHFKPIIVAVLKLEFIEANSKQTHIQLYGIR